jgi:malate dehydrogenase (oxaloacetate-decarboxylating)(NADP+)
MFLGLLWKCSSADMLFAMADNPVVFAMANPVPKIDYHLKATGPILLWLLGDQIILIK